MKFLMRQDGLAEHVAVTLARGPGANPVSDGATKAKTIGYWVTTGLVVFCMTGGIFELLGVKTTVDGIARLGYPAYIIPADRKSTRLNSSHRSLSRMPSSA